jgi:hypothetical protein
MLENLIKLIQENGAPYFGEQILENKSGQSNILNRFSEKSLRFLCDFYSNHIEILQNLCENLPLEYRHGFSLVHRQG